MAEEEKETDEGTIDIVQEFVPGIGLTNFFFITKEVAGTITFSKRISFEEAAKAVVKQDEDKKKEKEERDLTILTDEELNNLQAQAIDDKNAILITQIIIERENRETKVKDVIDLGRDKLIIELRRATLAENKERIKQVQNQLLNKK